MTIVETGHYVSDQWLRTTIRDTTGHQHRVKNPIESRSERNHRYRVKQYLCLIISDVCEFIGSRIQRIKHIGSHTAIEQPINHAPFAGTV